MQPATPMLRHDHGYERAPITKAVLYARISPQPGINNRKLDDQFTSAREACKAKGWHVIGEHEDKGVSGSVPPNERPGMIAARAALGPGVALVMWDQDRLERPDYSDFNAMGAFQAAIGWLITDTKSSIYLVKPDSFIHGEGLEPIDFFMFLVKSYLASEERRAIRSRTSRAMNHYVWEEGRLIGTTPFGKMPDPARPGYTIDNPAEEEVIRVIVRMHKQGKGCGVIERYLNENHMDACRGKRFHRSSIRKIIRNYCPETSEDKLTPGRKKGSKQRNLEGAEHYLPERDTGDILSGLKRK